MRRERYTKVIATLGPASSSPEMIEKLFEAGADVFRLNMSHGAHQEVEKRHEAIRAVERKSGRPIGILVDLQGPKIRIGQFAEDAVHLNAGDKFRLDSCDEPGDRTRIRLPHPELFAALTPGSDLLLDDGRIRLTVEKADGEQIDTVVKVGGELSSRKGVNVPNVVLPLDALTLKDKRDLKFALELGVDWIALSFVQRPEDVEMARELIAGRASILAKIEKPAALERLEDIMERSDAVMVARGDLGVEMPVEDVPGSQKRIIQLARKTGKTVVVATQMLESMVHSPVPTRAEVSDVANAVFEGADAVMLSAESAAGENPLEAVSVMSRIAEKVEQEPMYQKMIEAEHMTPEATSADAISAAARQVAKTLNATAIITYTTSGSTALRASRERPKVPVLALTPRIETARRLALSWGLHCVLTEDAHSFQDMVDKACRIAFREEFAQLDQRIIVTAGVPFGTPGKTNVLRIAKVGADSA
ncbi:MAG: pyruvate kinase [Sphingomonadales bacterium]